MAMTPGSASWYFTNVWQSVNCRRTGLEAENTGCRPIVHLVRTQPYVGRPERPETTGVEAQG